MDFPEMNLAWTHQSELNHFNNQNVYCIILCWIFLISQVHTSFA